MLNIAYVCVLFLILDIPDLISNMFVYYA